MQLTKFNHACFTVTKDTQTIVVDPGTFATDFVVPDSVVAIIITHQHADHMDIARIQAIVDRSPNAVIIGDESALVHLPSFKTQAVKAGQSLNLDPFALTFYGGVHAAIAPSIKPIANLGVLINDALYYPGDSFATPELPVDTLALPVCAPWMKISEAIEFLESVRPRIVFPTHDAILSDSGKEIYDRLLAQASQDRAIAYQRITAPIEIKTAS